MRPLVADLDEDFRGLPGEEAIRKGLEDLSEGKQTLESLLVQIGWPRLSACGVPVPKEIDVDADYHLYDLLAGVHGSEAHSKYNSWIRQLVSFERALERRRRVRDSRK